MGNIVKSTVILAIVAFISSFLLSHVKKITYPNILKQAKEKQEKALKLVLPGYKISEEEKVDIHGREFLFWEGEKSVDDKILKGYAFITQSPGYSGDIKSMVGIDEKGIILGYQS